MEQLIEDKLIDRVAMERGLAGSDDYLEEWKRGETQVRDGTAEDVVKAVCDELEAQFDALKAAASSAV